MGQEKNWPIAILVFLPIDYGNHSNTLKRFFENVNNNDFGAVLVFCC